MKLPLGLGFALLLMLQSLQQASTQDTDTQNENTSENDSLLNEESMSTSGALSGDGDHQFTNHTSEGMTVIPVTSEAPEGIEFFNSTPPPHIALNSSSEFSVDTNDTSTQKDNTSQPVTPKPDLRPPMTNDTGLNSTVTPQPETNSTEPGSGNFTSNETAVDTFVTQNSTAGDNVNSTTTHSPQHANTTTESPPENPNNGTNGTIQTTTSSLPTTESTTVRLYTPGKTTKLNRTGGSFDVRDNSERGLTSDIKQKAKNQAWGAVVGVGVAVGFVALVVYVIMKRRSHRNFSHRKLVEDVAPDPVLRLDTNEPLDLKYDGFAYYNPGLQGDNIQMTSFPRGHSN